MSLDLQTAAAIISLLNDYQLFKGRKPLGFLNNLLYDINVPDTGFNDITSGNNPGCGTEGFAASTGWDPVRFFARPLSFWYSALLIPSPLGHRPRVARLSKITTSA